MPGRFLPAGILGSNRCSRENVGSGSTSTRESAPRVPPEGTGNKKLEQVLCSGPGPSGAGIRNKKRMLVLGCHTGGIKAQAGRFHSMPTCPGFLHYAGR
ncbi:MAG: hypothetical protein R6U91_02855 [Bacillota bacterium]